MDRRKPFYSTLLPASSSTHQLADLAPEHVVVGVAPLIDCHIGHDTRQLLLFRRRPSTINPNLPVQEMIAIPVPAVGRHSANAMVYLFPLLAKISHSP